MLIRFTRTVVLPSGNEARNFRFHSLGYGRVQATYEYTDRRRAHQVARRYTVEFLNGRLQSITARSARGGRVECFSTSVILAELLEMLAEFNEASQDVAKSYRSEPAKVEEDIVSVEQDDTTTDLLDTVRLVGIGVVVNLMVTLVTLGVVWYNL